LVLTFFGLTPSYKKILLEEIFLLCYHSQGGFTHDEVYNMPIRYRHFYLHKLNETVTKQQEEVDKKLSVMNGSQEATSAKGPRERPPIPDFAYKARAPKN
jgi:hypothetical protein